MGALSWIAGKLGYVPKAERTTGYAAAEVGRLTASLSSESEYINNTLRYQLRRLRARSRQLTQNNPFGRRFVQLVVDNVCGATPFRLQAKVKSKTSGKLDTAANHRIEEAWLNWSKKGHCELTGRWSWNATQRLLVRNLATDGELLARKVRGPGNGQNGYMLQILDVDRLDDLLNKALPNGGAIHMGVELDPQSRVIAYHLLKRKPSAWQAGNYPREHERVLADEIIHVFVADFAEQVRGVPWMYAALLNLVHLGGFEEAAVIAARIGASQMGFIESPDGGQTLADGQAKGASGAPQIDAEPGQMYTMPPGYKFNAGWNPKYPDAAIEPFVKALLRGIAAGVNVAYHNLSGDMEGVNYSSARIAELDERDSWMTLQSFVTEHLHQPLYDDWLRWQVVLGNLPFDLARLDKYRAVYWQARRWQWVDPLKEVNAAKIAIDMKLKSRTRVVSEAGEDYEDVLDEIQTENQLAADKDVDLAPPVAPAAAQPAASTEEEEEDDDAKQTD